MKKIDSFTGEFFFLSNFYNSPITYENITYLNSEAAFQAQKTLNIKERQIFANCTPSVAKAKGRSVQLRSDWENVKDEIMYKIVKEKFSQVPNLKIQLLATCDAELIEGNTWNDKYWGVCNGEGKNMLGLILMRVRREFANENKMELQMRTGNPDICVCCGGSLGDAELGTLICKKCSGEL